LVVQELQYTLADPDYYRPLHRCVDIGPLYKPSRVPAGWAAETSTVWMAWSPSGLTPAEQGWKVHVSARHDRAQQVLDRFAEACFSCGVPFKHLAAELFFTVLHHKHGSRVQSGKFCTAFPSTVEESRRLMTRLAEALRDEEGPYILTDRRFGDSRTVHYRYGAYADRRRLCVDGTGRPLVRDGHGELVEDLRAPRFWLPDGMTDPFLGTVSAPAAPTGPVSIGGYRIDRVLRHSNAGGAYLGTEEATGRPVFLKEARAHTGLFWDGSTAQERLREEYAMLTAIHERAPGCCPRPVAYFREWEHEFLAAEVVPGRPLATWVAVHNPLVQAGPDAERYRDYYATCRRILDALAVQLDRLHAAGYALVDLNPFNVLVEDGRPRLVDFEAACRLDAPVRLMGAEGYAPPLDRAGARPEFFDAYGLSAIALFMLVPLHQAARRHPAVLRHLRYELAETAPVPDALWQLATRFHTERVEAAGLPAPEEVAARPDEHVAGLRAAVGRNLVAMAGAGDPDSLFPTVPAGHAANTLCVMYGTAGVLHALHTTGHEIPKAVLDRWRREVLDSRDDLPPGLHVGNAGIAWVLAELGRHDEAATVLAAADASPLLADRATLGEGIAGVGMAHLALYRMTGDPADLDRAVALAERIPCDAALVPLLGPHEATGLLHGRAGIALYLYYLGRLTGDAGYLRRGWRLLRAELDGAVELPDGSLSFRDSAIHRRAMPYLYAGSAGVLFAASRFLAAAPDAGAAVPLARIRADVTKVHAALPGLYCGLAGLGLTLAEHADLGGEPAATEQARRIGRALFKYAVPGPDGVRFHGDRGLRFSAELWSGSAGVLLFLDRLLTGRTDTFFTLDAAVAGAPVVGSAWWE
jgi:hypothetical protein